MNSRTVSHIEDIGPRVRTIRGQKVILDSDLARIYGVPTKRLNEQVKRNGKRFPSDFLFQLTPEEANSLRSQFATLEKGRGRYSKFLPFAFTQNASLIRSCRGDEAETQGFAADPPPYVGSYNPEGIKSLLVTVHPK